MLFFTLRWNKKDCYKYLHLFVFVFCKYVILTDWTLSCESRVSIYSYVTVSILIGIKSFRYGTLFYTTIDFFFKGEGRTSHDCLLCLREGSACLLGFLLFVFILFHAGMPAHHLVCKDCSVPHRFSLELLITLWKKQDTKFRGVNILTSYILFLAVSCRKYIFLCPSTRYINSD